MLRFPLLFLSCVDSGKVLPPFLALESARDRHTALWGPGQACPSSGSSKPTHHLPVAWSIHEPGFPWAVGVDGAGIGTTGCVSGLLSLWFSVYTCFF